MAETVAYKYRAFISYSHADTAQAKWLHRALESFTIDKDLAGQETPTGAIPKALRPIFRDRDDFAAGHSLTDQTRAALDASDALVVICSPSAAKSHYVNEEIRLFKSRHPERPVIPLIVAGKPGDPTLECFPPALKFKLDAEGQVTGASVEMLAADAREDGDGKSLALAKVVAGLLGVSSDDIFRRAERERRRHGRVRNAVIAGLAVLAVAATGSAAYAWHELKTNEAFLKETLLVASGIVDTAVAQAETYGVPRSAALAMLAKAEGLFDVMARLGRPTPELRYQKAWMLIQFSRNYAILGDTTRWRQRAEEAHKLIAELAADNPDEPSYQRTLAAAQNELGNILLAQGKLAEALTAFQEGLAITDRLAKAAPGDAALQRDLTICLDKVGDVLKAQGNIAEAAKLYRESLDIRSRLVERDQQTAEWQRQLSISNNKMGDVLIAQGNPQSALDSYLAALAITDRLAIAHPENVGLQRDLCVSHKKIGDALAAQSDFAGALQSYRETVAIAGRLVAVDPSNMDLQRGLAMTRSQVADVLVQQGKTPEALDEYLAARNIISRLQAQFPDNAALPDDLAWVDAKITKLEPVAGDAVGTQPQQVAR